MSPWTWISIQMISYLHVNCAQRGTWTMYEYYTSTFMTVLRTMHICNTVGVLWEAGTGYLSRAPEFTHECLVGSVLLIFLNLCFVLLCVFTFWVPCCDVRSYFRIQTMFRSSLHPVVCWRAHALLLIVHMYIVTQNGRFLKKTYLIQYYQSHNPPH